jgi:hypothetical protein
MFPSDVWEFQMPMMRPRFPLPNQLAMTVTTPGQPVDWNMPHATWRAGLDKTPVKKKKKKQPSGFFVFFGFFCFFLFLGFFVFFCFFIFCICPEEGVFRVFQFQEYFPVHPDFKL